MCIKTTSYKSIELSSPSNHDGSYPFKQTDIKGQRARHDLAPFSPTDAQAVWSFKILLKIPTYPSGLVKCTPAPRILSVRTFRTSQLFALYLAATASNQRGVQRALFARPQRDQKHSRCLSILFRAGNNGHAVAEARNVSGIGDTVFLNLNATGLCVFFLRGIREV